MRINGIYQGAIALALAGLLVSACSPDGDSGQDSNRENSEPAPGRTALEIANLLEPPNFLAYSGHGSRIQTYSPMLLPLLMPDHEQQYHSDLLESWEASDDGLTVTLRLRPDIAWNDGAPVTSADVVMTLTQYLDPSISIYSDLLSGIVGADEFGAGDADSVTGLSAPDEHSVLVELEEPTPWLAKLASLEGGVTVLPEHVLGDVPHDELEEHEYFTTFPVTNGPYNFVEALPAQHVEYERNPSWSLGEAAFERVFLKWVDPEVTVAQLETGEVQFFGGVAPIDADRLNGVEGIEVQSTSQVNSTPKWTLMHHEPLLDRRVRQAMAYAIDRQGICEQVLQRYCSVPVANIPQLGPEWAIPSEDMIEYRYDPDKARELLDEAGWDPNTELTFLNWLGGEEPESTILEIAQGNMAEVGINWSFVNVDGPTLTERLEQESESFHGYPAAGGNFTLDPSSVRPWLSCDAFPPAGLNGGYFCNQKLDKLLDAGEAETDENRRAEIYHEAFRIINQEVPAIHLATRESIAAYDARLKGVKAHGEYGAFLWNIADWHWEE